MYLCIIHVVCICNIFKFPTFSTVYFGTKFTFRIHCLCESTASLCFRETAPQTANLHFTSFIYIVHGGWCYIAGILIHSIISMTDHNANRTEERKPASYKAEHKNKAASQRYFYENVYGLFIVFEIRPFIKEKKYLKCRTFVSRQHRYISIYHWHFMYHDAYVNETQDSAFPNASIGNSYDNNSDIGLDKLLCYHY